MPLVQYSFPIKGINVTKRMFAPKRQISDPLAWYKAISKLIPELPKICPRECPSFCLSQGSTISDKFAGLPPEDHWHFTWDSIWTVSPRYIKFEMQNSLHERSHLVIDRSVPGIG